MADEQPQNGWRNWSNHPAIVTVGVLAAIITIGGAAWAVFRKGNDTPPITTTTGQREFVSQKPEEIIAWYVGIKDEAEARRQFQLLYRGRWLRARGNVDIYAATRDAVHFTLGPLYGRIAHEKMAGSLSEQFKTTVICRIERVTRITKSSTR